MPPRQEACTHVSLSGLGDLGRHHTVTTNGRCRASSHDAMPATIDTDLSNRHVESDSHREPMYVCGDKPHRPGAPLDRAHHCLPRPSAPTHLGPQLIRPSMSPSPHAASATQATRAASLDLGEGSNHHQHALSARSGLPDPRRCDHIRPALYLWSLATRAHATTSSRATIGH